MRILILNQDWFKDEFLEAGHEAITCGMGEHLDVPIATPLMHIDSVIASLPNNFSPDVILWHDNSAPCMFTGLDETDTPCLFYSVDAQHHSDLHTNLAHVFDHTYVAQKDYIPLFERNKVRSIEWLPLWAPRYVEQSNEKKFNSIFVGSMNARLNPDRVAFFDELKKHTDIVIEQGAYWNLFPFSEIVVNQTVKSDLNFRVFEGMMCGSLMLTEATSNGLFELFKDGEHIVTYERGNAQDAASKINMLLNDKSLCRKIAENGRDEILNRHRPQHRAEVILNRLRSLQRTKNDQRFLGSMLNFGILSLPLEKKDTAICGKSLIAALRAAEQSLEFNEKPNELQTFYFIVSAIRYDRILGSTAGTEMIHRFAEAHPENMAIGLTKVRALLNSGRVADAKAYAHQLAPIAPELVFKDAELLVAEFLKLVDNYNPSLFP